MKRLVVFLFILTTVKTGKFKFKNKFSSLLKLVGETFAQNGETPFNFENSLNVLRKGEGTKRKRKRWKKKDKSTKLKQFISTMTFPAKAKNAGK